MATNKASDEGVFVKKGLWAMRIQSWPGPSVRIRRGHHHQRFRWKTTRD